MRDMIWRCDLAPQYEAYKEEIDNAIDRVLRSGRYVLGENVAAFETEFAQYIGCDYGVGVNSGTDALMLALWCFNLQPGDEVITTPFTAIPTYSAIRHSGAKPVFVDVEPDTFLIDLEQVERAVTERTKAVVPVHLFGNVVDVLRLRRIVGPRIIILEDCAQSHGASIGGRKVGALGDIAAFSFYPTKNLGAYGDGGMVLTNNREFADLIRLRRMYGMVSKDEFVVDGVNSRLDELQAAILRVKLRHLDAMNRRRVELAAVYNAYLNASCLKPQVVVPDAEAVYHVYGAVCAGRRDELATYLEHRRIQTNVYYPMPLTKQRAVQGRYGEMPSLPVAERLSKQIIALPFYPEIAVETLEYVARQVNEFYGN